MAEPAIVMFDDRLARDWMPFALTRPAGELLYGALCTRRRAELVFGGSCVGHVAAAHLAAFEEPDAPPVLATPLRPNDRATVYLSSRAIPAWGGARPALDRAAVLTVAGEVVGCVVPPGGAPPSEDFLLDPARCATAQERLELGGAVLGHVWDLISGNMAQVATDVAALHAGAQAPVLAAGVYAWGDHRLVAGPGVRLDPGVVLDLSEGPIWLDRGVVVRPFTRVAGPSYIGPGTTLLGGDVACVSIGAVCKIHGQIEESVVLGYSNKQHEGFLGHSYVGCWVNLGAMTTTSDLKNNYGTVRLWTPEGEADSGETKLGCLLGDHVKTGIGTLVNTGTIVGAGSNLYGAAMPPRHVPPFSWGTGEELVAYRLEKFLDAAERAMARRDVPLSERGRELLSAAWWAGRGE